MNTTLTTAVNTITNNRNDLLAGAGIAIAFGLSACGGTNEQSDVATPIVPIAEPAVEILQPAAEQTADRAATSNAPSSQAEVAEQQQTDVAGQQQADTGTSTNTAINATTVEQAAAAGQFVPASSADLPCESYHEATELPLFPCSKGELVKEFQQWVAYAQPDFEVDGYFGPATHDAVVGYQLSFQMLDTGVIDELLMEMMELSMAHDEPIDEDIDDDHIEDWHGEVPGEGLVDDEEFEVIHDITEWESCQILAGDLFAFGDQISDEQIRVCDDLGVPILGE